MNLSKESSIGESMEEHPQKELVRQSDKQQRFLERRTSAGEEALEVDSVAAEEEEEEEAVEVVEWDLQWGVVVLQVEWGEVNLASMVRDDFCLDTDIK